MGSGQPGTRRSPLVVALTVVAALVVIGGGTAIGVVLGQGSGGSNGSTAEAQSDLAAAMAAARRAGSFHYVAYSSNAEVNSTVVGNSGPTSGDQHFTVNGSSFTEILLRGVVYFKGDAASLQDQLQLTPSVADSEAGHWISVVSGDSPYQPLEAGITTTSALSEILITPLSVTHDPGGAPAGTVRIVGTLPPASGSIGPVSGSAQLDVDSGTNRPSSYLSREDSPDPGTSSTRFSRWGERVHETAPTGAVPYSQLGTAGPPASAGPGGGTSAATFPGSTGT